VFNPAGHEARLFTSALSAAFFEPDVGAMG
jgi:hypothetical protein